MYEFENAPTASPTNHIAAFKYDYDGLYRRKNMEYVHRESGGTHYYDLYVYDDVDRLTKYYKDMTSTTPSGTPERKFVYDAAGNRTLVKDDNDADLHTYTPNKANEYDVIDGSDRYNDDKGNYVGLKNTITLKYHWDYANRLAHIYEDNNYNNKYDAGDLKEWIYTYDASSRRVQKEGPNGARTRYVYSGWQVVEERNGNNGSIEKGFAYGNNLDEVLLMRAKMTPPGAD